ncbi:response regulator [Aquimarina pacifica]|uniref:response regulator n=1 Tax=Aquimarina pacifica TaxID=1296415 RepID=UPI0004707F59|nr:response regulator transcription factor [Aquimarina pacifica]
MSLNPSSFLICDDHEVVLQGLFNVIQKNWPNSKIDFAKSGSSAFKKFSHDDYHFLITDISMEGNDGIALCRKVKEHYPKTKIIVISQHKKIWMIKQLYTIQVDGLLLKEDSIQDLSEAIPAILSGKKYYTRSINEIILNYIVNKTEIEINQIELTFREEEIIQLIAQELTTQEISEKLFISKKTVETHRKNLLLKFGARNMVGLIKKAMELGFLD